MAAQHKIPYTQQFAPEQTPLPKLIAILRQHQGKASKLKEAIGSAFFRETKSPQKMAANTLIALKYCDILDAKCALTAFGNRLLSHQRNPKSAHEELARHILFNLDGIMVVETLREMKQANVACSLVSIAKELRQRGFEVSDNSSDLSGVLNWLRQAGVLDDYAVVEGEYGRLVGTPAPTIEALKNLAPEQVAFLRSLTALGATDWAPYSDVVEHAEALYPGQVSYNWKEIDRTILKPLSRAGFIEVRKRPKSTSGARGGKTADVKPTEKFNGEVAEPILVPIYRAAGFRKVREIRSIPFAEIVEQVRQKKDADARGRAPNVLEFANTESNSRYLVGCREAGIKPHPARFPIALPKFFIRFLTRPGELVLDPFAGSNVAGEAAEKLGRRWIGVEISEEYVKGSQLRFTEPVAAADAKESQATEKSAAPRPLLLPFAQ